ncbi:MAG: 1-acyl-sn-glycerol-3-phosphate acyltransferase [Gemmatimonadaceae bacterium]|nr:1-acyl-sn-glycerol-3-phosphate acyltransferase [Gemmatimonadaceae bacterium]
MIYGLLRWFTGIALHWFYSSIQVVGRERLPANGPVLLAASHHNALVDALIAGWVAPRRLTLTAKATLMDNVFLAWLFPILGVVPLRRASDERNRVKSSTSHKARNTGAFESILDVLEGNGMVLIFPEGRSHSEAALAPLKTGVSRIALAARDERGIRGLRIVPLGLSFEDKGKPGTAVLAEVGDPVLMDSLGPTGVDDLTANVAQRLAAVSLKTPEPSPDRDSIRRKRGIRPLASPLAAWGELTHRYIINYARDLAIRQSRSPDDPAMLTIIFALIFILASYIVQFAIAWALAGLWWAVFYVAMLPVGAYWAAFRYHSRPDREPIIR